MRAVKIPHLEGGSTGPRTESCVNSDGPFSMVPCLHQGNIYIKRNLRVWKDQKCIPLVGAIAPLNGAGRKLLRLEGGSLGPRTESCVNCHGPISQCTVFAPRKYLYQKEAKGMERPEMYSVSRCNNPTIRSGTSKYPVSREAA